MTGDPLSPRLLALRRDALARLAKDFGMLALLGSIDAAIRALDAEALSDADAADRLSSRTISSGSF
jgi:hypothetical protein